MKKFIFTLIALTMAVHVNAENNVRPARAFSVRVELSKQALAKLTTSAESVLVVATFADEIGPGGDYYGEAQYEMFKPSLATIGVIAIPSSSDQKIQQIDYEVNVNVVSGRRRFKDNILNCEIIEGKLSDLLGRTKVVQCDLI